MRPDDHGENRRLRVARLRPGDGVSVARLVAEMPPDWSRPFCGFAAFFELCRASTGSALPTAYVASIDGTGVATINVVEYDDFPDYGPWLANAVVLPEYRGLGLWKQVRLAAVADAGAMGFERLRTYTSSTQVAAVSRAAGWRHLGERSRDGSTVDVFELDLPVATQAERSNRAPAPLRVGVFGSLRRGQPNHDAHLSDGRRCVYLGTGTIAGSLYEVPQPAGDAPAPYSYPLYLPDEGGRVVVEVYEIVDPTLLGEMDDLESLAPGIAEYVRVRTPVTVPDRPDIDRVWVYEYARPLPGGLVRIASGDWLEFVSAGTDRRGS